MPYTATSLITEAYKLSSLVSRQFEDIQGYQLLDGLRWLNELLGDTATDYGAIPYITTYFEFNGTPGQEKYYLRNLIDIQSCVFFIQDIRYEMKYITRKQYFSLPRANNINALPLSYTYERAPHGINLFVYFRPQQDYVIQIVGNMYQNIVNLNQDLQLCVADLGVPILSQESTFTLAPFQFVVNGVDLQGTYSDTPSPFEFTAIQCLVNYINTGTQDGTGSTPLIQHVWAEIQGERFVLLSKYGGTIQITTKGVNSTDPNYIITEDGQIIVTEDGSPLVMEESLGNLTFECFPLDQGLFINEYHAWDQFWINYWEYSLADRICQKFDFVTPENVTNQLNIYRQRLIKDAEAVDLAANRISILGRAVGINYAQANIGRGFTTSN